MSDKMTTTLLLLEPLSTLCGKHLTDAQVQLWHDQLKDYTSEDLTTAYQELARVWKWSKFPRPADIHEARDKGRRPNKNALANPYSADAGEMPWERLEKDRKKMVDEYLQHFQAVSVIYGEGLRDGWNNQLMKYVEECAIVQAQVLLKSVNGMVHYSNKIFPSGLEYDQIKAELHKIKDQAAQAGRIDVSIPTSMIAEWQREVRWQRREEDRLLSRGAYAPKQPVEKPKAEDYAEPEALGEVLEELLTAEEPAC